MKATPKEEAAILTVRDLIKKLVEVQDMTVEVWIGLGHLDKFVPCRQGFTVVGKSKILLAVNEDDPDVIVFDVYNNENVDDTDL